MTDRMTMGFIQRMDNPKDALVRRVHAGLDRMLQDLPEDIILNALAASSDLGALARILSDPRLRDPALQLDPMTSVLARSFEHRVVLLDLAGPVLSATEVGAVLGISRQAVDKRRAGGKLLAVRVGGDWRYPEFQFADGAVLPGFEVLMAAHDGQDPWSILDSLVARDSALGDRSLIEALREGDSESVSRAIRQMESDGFA